MAAKRPNPKKDKSARRQRPKRPALPANTPPGLRQAQFSLESAQELMLAATPDTLPLVGVAAVWLWSLAGVGAPAAFCIDGCVTLHYALAEYGIRSRVEAVRLEIEGNGLRVVYGDQRGPHYNPAGTFIGHAVLVVPDAGWFVDPTVQQYSQVPDTESARRPLLCPLPSPDGLGEDPISVDRGDHVVVYRPVPQQQRQSWRRPVYNARATGFQRAGANLAANAFAFFRLEELRAKTAASPYPRLPILLAALENTEPVTTRRGFRFKDPTGRELRLADVP